MNPSSARDQDAQFRAACNELADEGRGLRDVLEVVDDQQYPSVCQKRHTLVESGYASSLTNAKRASDGRSDLCSAADRCKRHHARAVRKPGGKAGSYRDGNTRLA